MEMVQENDSAIDKHLEWIEYHERQLKVLETTPAENVRAWVGFKRTRAVIIAQSRWRAKVARRKYLKRRDEQRALFRAVVLLQRKIRTWLPRIRRRIAARKAVRAADDKENAAVEAERAVDVDASHFLPKAVDARRMAELKPAVDERLRRTRLRPQTAPLEELRERKDALLTAYMRRKRSGRYDAARDARDETRATTASLFEKVRSPARMDEMSRKLLVRYPAPAGTDLIAAERSLAALRSRMSIYSTRAVQGDDVVGEIDLDDVLAAHKTAADAVGLATADEDATSFDRDLRTWLLDGRRRHDERREAKMRKAIAHRSAIEAEQRRRLAEEEARRERERALDEAEMDRMNFGVSDDEQVLELSSDEEVKEKAAVRPAPITAAAKPKRAAVRGRRRGGTAASSSATTTTASNLGVSSSSASSSTNLGVTSSSSSSSSALSSIISTSSSEEDLALSSDDEV